VLQRRRQDLVRAVVGAHLDCLAARADLEEEEEETAHLADLAEVQAVPHRVGLAEAMEEA
jgi:hypothetical protein